MRVRKSTFSGPIFPENTHSTLTNSITVKSSEWKMMFQTVLLSFVTNFRGKPYFLPFAVCPYPNTPTERDPLPYKYNTYRKNTFDCSYHLLFVKFHSTFFTRPFIRPPKKCPHINSLPSCVRLSWYNIYLGIYIIYTHTHKAFRKSYSHRS